MSAGGEMDVTCSCGHHFDAWLWQSANVTTNPELKTTILNGEMNIVKCPSCGARFHVEIPFLYHDMSGKEWIWVYPLGYEKEKAGIQVKVGEMWDRITGSMSPDGRESLEREYKVSVLFGMDALVGYLRPKSNN